MDKKKLYERIKRSKKSVNFDDFIVVVKSFGFERTRWRGSHNVYKCCGVAEILNIQSLDGKAKEYQIDQFLSLVDKYGLKQEE